MDRGIEGNYLISIRDACVVHKINGTSGKTIWRLGGTDSNFLLGPEVEQKIVEALKSTPIPFTR